MAKTSVRISVSRDAEPPHVVEVVGHQWTDTGVDSTVPFRGALISDDGTFLLEVLGRGASRMALGGLTGEEYKALLALLRGRQQRLHQSAGRMAAALVVEVAKGESLDMSVAVEIVATDAQADAYATMVNVIEGLRIRPPEGT